MAFKDALNSYLKEINSSSKKLSDVSGISESVISRYRSGDRTPNKNDTLIKLSDAIYTISLENNKLNYKKEDILKKLKDAIKEDEFNYDTFSLNFNKLISALNINTNDMSKYIVFDASHISRIRYAKSKPSDPKEFSTKICNYVTSKYNDSDSLNILSTLMGCKKEKIEKDLFNTLYNWLISNDCNNYKNNIENFLNHLNDFNLNDYIKAIKFDELKVPNIPFYRGRTKNYYGLEEMKKAELDFFKIAVLSKNKEDIFMHSNMPMEDMAKDIQFGKKWMFGIALSLKKGLNLNIIHNLDRPFDEMMLGLESWIPIYMTGQVSPYYLKEVKNSVYNHLNYVCGSAALCGECIKGYHDKGKYYLTNNKKEIEYYKEKANLLLKKANSLMDIYKEENKNDFKVFMLNDSKLKVNRRRIISTLPIETIDNNLLEEILKYNNVSKKDKKLILKYKMEEEENINKILKDSIIENVIYEVKKDEFANEEFYLSLENMFYDKKIKYNYDMYKKHLASSKNYSKKHQNYKIIKAKDKTFKNISITILKNNYVILSKSANPIIHFVIRHPKLVNAIENFSPLVKEEA